MFTCHWQGRARFWGGAKKTKPRWLRKDIALCLIRLMASLTVCNNLKFQNTSVETLKLGGRDARWLWPFKAVLAKDTHTAGLLFLQLAL